MASSNQAKRQRVGVRQSLQLTHASEEAKRAFYVRLDRLRQAFTPGSTDNLSLVTKLVEVAEHLLSSSQATHSQQVDDSTTFLKSGGKCC